MTVGFKTGPRNWAEGQQIVTKCGARMCEVWFRADQTEQYTEPIGWFRQRHVAVGLHFWGLCKDNVLPNVATNHAAVRTESIKQMKQTVDFAQRNGCIYVNIHPGAQYLENIIFEPLTFSLQSGAATPRAVAEQLMIQAAHELHDYATERGIVLTIETITRFMMRRPLTADRQDFYDPGTMHLPLFQQLAQQGIYIANDITHTAAALPLEKPSREALWQGVRDFTQSVAPQTRLIHVNTLRPPFNGTDSHDGVTEDDFRRGVFPDRSQIIALLALFSERPEVFVVPEPLHDMAGNFQALLALSEEALAGQPKSSLR